ncbi:MAG: phage tail tube protein [Butyricicoccaceae bacterium]
MANSGVYPCYENQFKIGSAKESTNTIADMETFSVSFDNGVEEWTPFETEGWVRRLMTAKAVTISVNGKRNVGDTGNDFVSGLAFKNGRNAEAYFEWTFPDGTVVTFAEAVVNVTNIGAGDSTNVGPLEFEVMSNGKPSVTLPSGS